MKKIDLDDIRKIAVRATDGPWELEESGYSILVNAPAFGDTRRPSMVCLLTNFGGVSDVLPECNAQSRANADLIAACDPESILRIIDVMETLTAKVSEMMPFLPSDTVGLSAVEFALDHAKDLFSGNFN